MLIDKLGIGYVITKRWEEGRITYDVDTGLEARHDEVVRYCRNLTEKPFLELGDWVVVSYDIFDLWRGADIIALEDDVLHAPANPS